MESTFRGAGRRLVASGAAAALAVAGLSLGMAAPAHAAPVTITGTLTDAAGNALDGYVYAQPVDAEGHYNFELESTYATVADGVISINVEPGTYKFRFGDEDSLFVDEYYNDKATFELADAVPITGAASFAPVVLAARPSITGIVQDASGQPVTNGWVEVTNVDTLDSNWANLRKDGTFAVGVEAGAYKVYATGSGLVGEYYNNKSTFETADVVPAGAGLDPIILSEGSILQGQVVSQNGVPLERARVSVYPATGSGGSVGDDLTDAAGMYRIENLAPGDYKVQFTDPVGEFGTEWHTDRTDRATADVVSIGIDAIVDVNAVLWPDPEGVIDPAKVDVSGTVVDSSGAPVIAADVTAYDTPADGDTYAEFTSVRTNRAGQFFFTELDQTSETVFKFQAADNLEREEGQYYRLTRWYGDTQDYDTAAEVTRPAGGVNVTLPLTGGISGTVTSESALSVAGVGVYLEDENGDASGWASAEKDGTYLSTYVMPGTYKVRFLGGGTYIDNVLRTHAPEWYDNTVKEKAKTVTIKSGETVTGIDAALSEDLRAMRAPEVRGQAYIGKKVRAYPGVWSVRTGTTFIYEWLIDGVVVAKGESYRIPKSAKNERITLRVTAENGSLSGTALATSQKLQLKPKVKIAVKGVKAMIKVKYKKMKAKKIKGSVIVKRIKRLDDFGAPVYKKIAKGKIRNGKSTVTLKKLKKGKNKLVFFIKLKGKLGDAAVAKTVKFKKR